MLLLCFLILNCIPRISALQALPTWVTSAFVQAETFNLANNLTTSATVPSATLVFPTAFTGTPDIAYGVIKYQGNDFFGQQNFYLTKTSLDSSSFTIALQITGITSIWVFSVRYFAVDPTFPHHLNSFNSIPANYGNGLLVNISTSNSSFNQYSNTINYTSLASSYGYSHKVFLEPLSNNKIVLFITGFSETGTVQTPSDPLFPLSLKINTAVLSTDSFMLKVLYGSMSQINALYFSIIVFDYADVLSSQTYQMCYQEVYFSSSGGLIPIYMQFVSNLIIGLIQFDSAKTSAILHFNLMFSTPNGLFGIYMPPSIPRFTAASFSNFGYSLLYLKSWLCPVDTFYNVSSTMCQSCSVLNCGVCLYLTFCSICNTGYYVSNVTGQCLANSQICGDNLFGPYEQCDDGNIRDGDGCSSACRIQSDFVCQLNIDSSIQNSLCFYVGQIILKLIYIDKKDYSNQIEIRIQIEPKHLSIWDSVNFMDLISLPIQMQSFITNYYTKVNSDGSISIIASYNRDICHFNITIQFHPLRSGLLVLSRQAPVITNFQIIPDDNESAMFYQESVYELARVIYKMSYAIASVSLLLFVLSMYQGRVIVIQMIAVLQVSYLSLIDLKYLNPCFKALSKMWLVNGFSISKYILGQNLLDPQIPKKLRGINVYTQFFKNYNFMLLAIIIPAFCSFVCLIAATVLDYKNRRKNKINHHSKGKTQKIDQTFNTAQTRKNLKKLAKLLAFEYVFNGLMFSGYIICVSLMIQIKYQMQVYSNYVKINSTPIRTNSNGSYQYSQLQMISIIQFAIILLLSVLYFILKVIRPQYFGQFNSYFAIRKFDRISSIQNSNKNQDKSDLQQTNTRLKSKSQDKQGLKEQSKDKFFQDYEQHIDTLQQKYTTRVSKFWYHILLLQRYVVGIALVLMMDYRCSFVIPIVVFASLIVVTVIKKPYNKPLHNYRFCGNMVVCILIQSIYLVFNLVDSNSNQMGSSENDVNNQYIWFYMPLVICSLLLACLTYNTIIFIYEWVSSCADKKKTNQRSIQMQSMDQNFNYDYMRSLLPLPYYSTNRNINSIYQHPSNLNLNQSDNTDPKQIASENQDNDLDIAYSAKNSTTNQNKEKLLDKEKCASSKRQRDKHKSAPKQGQKSKQDQKQKKICDVKRKLNQKTSKNKKKKKIKLQLSDIKRQLGQEVIRVKQKIYRTYLLDLSMIQQNSREYQEI